MKRFYLHGILLAALILLLAACSPTGGAPEPTADEGAATVGSTTAEAAAPTDTPTGEPATEEPATAEPSTDTSACPAATDDTYLLRNPQHGYCLLYPTTHKVERPNPDEVNLVVGSLLNASDPRANIRVVSGDGLTAAAYADQIVADFAGFEIARSETTVAGEPAVVLDNLPGQDINRQVIFTHEGRLYHLYFIPLDPANPAALNDFAQGILDSLTFIPVSETVTAADECVEPKTDEQAITSEAFDFCLVVPAGFTFEEASESNANLFVGSMMDVEHPKLMIEVTDAAGQTATQAADALALSFPDMEIQRTFGDSLGYLPAERLDGVPGQDLGRVLLVVQDGRLYRLTFVPADPGQTAVYEQMEALYRQVINTWRFLP